MNTYDSDESGKIVAAMASTRLVYDEPEPSRQWYENALLVEALAIIAVATIIGSMFADHSEKPKAVPTSAVMKAQP